MVIIRLNYLGGDKASDCSQKDTGIWGFDQMIEILKVTDVKGTAMWSIDNYFKKEYYDSGNPENYYCNWSNMIADYYKIKNTVHHRVAN